MKLLSAAVILGLVSLTIASSLSSSLLSDPVIRAWYADYLFDSYQSSTPKDASLVPLAKIKNGTVRGEVAYSGTTKILRWQGIPFAKAPVGELRFQSPQPYDTHWGDTNFQATKHPNACIQYRTNTTRADEDCLYLSIYSRRKSNTEPGTPLPVIVFIHGGGFVFGQNSVYSGIKLLKNAEIVLVTIQYRLGPLGFLSTGDNTVSANNGMKDQTQALRWVQENIAAFGGDPTKVTVMGESAGSASALYHLISPLSKGLFQSVVAMSGTPIQEWAIDRDPWATTVRLANKVNCSTESSQVVVDCLRTVDPIVLAQAGFALNLEDFSNLKIVLHGSTPTIEGPVEGAFLPEDPLEMMIHGDIPDVPVLLGSVQHEGILPLAGAYILKLHKEGLLDDKVYMENYFLGDLLRTYDVNERGNGASISQAISLAFIPPEKNRTDFSSVQYELLDLLSVVFMKAPIQRTADILSRRLSSVYLYSFEYYSKNSFYNYGKLIVPIIIGGEMPKGLKPGICHADDLMYMFKMPFILSVKDQKFSKSYVELFTNFAIHGNPTPAASDDYPVWPKYEGNGKNYLKMSLPFEVKQDYSGSWRQGMPDY